MTGVEKVTARKMTPFKECGEGGWNDGCLDDNGDDEEEDGSLEDNVGDGLEKKIT